MECMYALLGLLSNMLTTWYSYQLHDCSLIWEGSSRDCHNPGGRIALQSDGMDFRPEPDFTGLHSDAPLSGIKSLVVFFIAMFVLSWLRFPA